ncbi:hypothetical protein M758_8G119100 [Ceratodon purpureus]|nr:hypothetical protein M758_8G119100 [Ceratodon purpureus]KAG0608611.1 hypothetical protein M758_8G119100 [Ceratodon purpureus]
MTEYREPPIYVPLDLKKPKEFAAFNKELVNAVTCCEAVEQNPWSSHTAEEVLRQACRRKGHATVRAVSLPSGPWCAQPFMAFEAKEENHISYIIAFRNDRECYNDIVTTPSAFAENLVENDKNFQVNESLWWRASAVPIQSLPPQWRSGLRDRRHRLILTGFSVGGAVAALATLQLLEAEDPDLRQQICCYTFGAPLQGDQNYANRINYTFASNFYHVIIHGDKIPGVLTLISKVAETKPDVCSDVVSNICKVLPHLARTVASAALEVVQPGAGAIVGTLANLGSGIKNLIVTERDSRMPLPEYKFGGSLVLLYVKERQNGQMTFVQLLGDGRVLENMFCVEEKDVTPSGLGVHRLKTFYNVINDLDNSALTQAIKSFASAAQQNFDRTPEEFSQSTLDHSLDQISEMVKDGAGRVAKSTTSAAKSATNAAKSAARCVTQPNVQDEQYSSTRYLLEPKFDVDKPIQVWLDNHENITVEVYGENMVLGIHVLYMIGDNEMLRIPYTERYMPQYWPVENSKDPQKPIEQALSNLPLQFSTQGIKGLTFKEPGGYFKVELAFGRRSKVEASQPSQVKIRMFDALDLIKVAERFSTETPEKLMDLLIFWGTAIAQAQCTAAFYAIQKYPQDADDIVKKTLDELRDVPPEFVLLDKLLALLDTSQFPYSVLHKLPSKMRETLKEIADDVQSTVIVPYFSAGNESAAWTFGGCYTRSIQKITKEMLSKKETAERLSTGLDDELAKGPKQMIIHYLDHQFQFKEYKNKYDIKYIEAWKKEREVAKDVTSAVKTGATMVPVVNVPLIVIGKHLDSDFGEFLGKLGKLIGLPTGLVGAGLAGSALWLYHIASSPFRKRPGLTADWKRRNLTADNYEQKLQAAALLFHCNIEPPLVACRLEYALYAHLKDRVPKDGCFNEVSTMSVQKVKYEATTALQLANFGLAGAKIYEIRRHLTERKTALGLIGSSQAGKSTFANKAFGVESHAGAGKNARTRVLRHWTLELPRSKNRQFTLIDFPGSTDHAAPHWYIRGQLLASVLVVVLSMKEITSSQAVTLVEKACKVRRKDKEVSVLFCFTCADQSYETYRDEAEEMDDGHTTAAQLFTQNFESYKTELLNAVSAAAGDADQRKYIDSHMHACCFKPTLQDVGTTPLAQDLQNVKVKNIKWVKDWCLEKLLTINQYNNHSGRLSFG